MKVSVRTGSMYLAKQVSLMEICREKIKYLFYVLFARTLELNKKSEKAGKVEFKGRKLDAGGAWLDSASWIRIQRSFLTG
jgi:hypothetical protein